LTAAATHDINLDVLCYREYCGFDWLITPISRRIFYIGSLGTFLFVVLRLLVILARESLWRLSEFAIVLLSTMLMVGALFAATVVIGMFCFWLRFDRGTTIGHTLWLLAIVFSPFFAALYCLMVYRRYAPATPQQSQELPQPATP
jgi:hypothetical protein